MPKISKPGLFRNHAIISPQHCDETLESIKSELITELLQAHGALLFRGFPLNVDVFGALSNSLCTHAVANDSPGRSTIDKKNAIQTVDGGDAPFPLHAELAREPWKPDVCLFGCLEPPKQGGETTICDGTIVARKLPRTVFNALVGRKLRYIKRATPEELKYWIGFANPSEKALKHPPEDCPFEFFKVEGATVRAFNRPILHRTMFNKQLCFGNFLLFSRYLHKIQHFPVFEDNSIIPDELVDKIKRTAERRTESIKWQKNDLLILDNTRFMHGRNAIKNTEERSIITYFGFLQSANPSDDEGVNPRWRKPTLWRRIPSNT